VSRRWLGGLLTNYHTISKRIKRLHELTELQDDDQLELLPTKERMTMEAELAKLEFNLGGVRGMERVPDAIIIVDLVNEEIGLAEATRLGIPIIGLVDTNCDPRGVDFVIPGNDDAIRSCDLIIRSLGEAILTSASAWEKAEEARRAREAEEKRKREEAERERREAEAKAKAEAEAAARAKAQAEAEAAAKAGKPAPKPAAPAQGKGQGQGPAKPAPKPAPKQRAKPVPVAQQTKAAASPAKVEEPAAPAKPGEGAEEGGKPTEAAASGKAEDGEGK
jgi:small subunit ribosomal protein S2